MAGQTGQPAATTPRSTGKGPPEVAGDPEPAGRAHISLVLSGLVFGIALAAALLIPALLPPAGHPSACRQFAVARSRPCATAPPTVVARLSGHEELTGAPVVRDAQIPGYGP